MSTKKINLSSFGFSSNYYLTEDGRLYNAKTRKLHPFREKLRIKEAETGKYKTMRIKPLYQRVYNKNFFIDNTESLFGEVWKQV